MSVFIEIFTNPFPGAIFSICDVTQGYSISLFNWSNIFFVFNSNLSRATSARSGYFLK